MTPRLNIIALKETADMDELMKIILEKKIAKIPLYTKNLDNITGIIHVEKIVPVLMSNKSKQMRLTDIAVKPIFISEYSSLLYVLKEFKRHQLNIAVILDEYSSTIGILTISDILREILGEIKISYQAIRKTGENQFIIKGSLPVEEINSKLDIKLPEKKDYTTLSGMFIYYFGKFPREGAKIKINGIRLMVKRMGIRKIEEILVEVPKVLVRLRNGAR
jgi:CBS domain containing-hemolysin-like protein